MSRKDMKTKREMNTKIKMKCIMKPKMKRG